MLAKYPPGPAICLERKENTELAAVSCIVFPIPISKVLATLNRSDDKRKNNIMYLIKKKKWVSGVSISRNVAQSLMS